MSLNRTPSPLRSGGWSSPGLRSGSSNSNRNIRRSPSPHPQRSHYDNDPHGVTWESAKAKGYHVNGYANGGGFLRSISSSLPNVYQNGSSKYEGGGRMPRGRIEKLKYFSMVLWRHAWRWRSRFMILLAVVLLYILFYTTPLHRIYRRTPYLGGGAKFVIILAANEGGGVMEWKGPREWAIERDSVKNKKKYAALHGYELEIVDMATKKRYAHEWRESWEKADAIRRCLREYPQADWFWWLDLNTFIMEPSYSLQRHIFNDLAVNTYRDINVYNPLGIQHPLTAHYLDETTRSPDGDGKPESINMLIPQDCSGFNLGSFFMRRSAWTERVLDMWWDPVHYEQKHMQWEHKEQDAFEHLYRSQPWIRPHTAFLPQRKACSYPAGACGDRNKTIHYDADDRDFLVNMAGCEWGRDCWGEMYGFRELSKKLNRGVWERFRDALAGGWKKGELIEGEAEEVTAVRKKENDIKHGERGRV